MFEKKFRSGNGRPSLLRRRLGLIPSMARFARPRVRQSIVILLILVVCAWCPPAQSKQSADEPTQRNSVATAQVPHEIQRLHIKGYINAIAWNADGSRLAAALTDNNSRCRVWETSGWSVVKDFDCITYAGKSIAFHPDGSLLTSGGFFFASSALDPADVQERAALVKWDADSGKPTLDIPGTGGNWRFTVSQDGALIAGLGDGPTLYDGKTGKLLRTMKVPRRGNLPDSANSLALSPDGRELAVGTLFGRVHFFRTSDGTLLRSLQAYPGETYACEAIAYSPDGKFIATAKNQLSGWPPEINDNEATIWRVSDNTVVAKLSGSTWYDKAVPIRKAVAADTLAWDKSGSRLAVGDGLALRVWLITDEAPVLLLEQDIKTIRGPEDFSKPGVSGVAFSPQGLLAVTEDKAVVIYQFINKQKN